MDEERKAAIDRKKKQFSLVHGRRRNSDMPVIVFHDVSKDYDSVNNGEMHSLKNVSFEINKGEFVFIIGDSGAGKSTMLRLLMKEIEPSDGTIYVDGRRLNRFRRGQVAMYRRSVGMVFQDFRLLKDRDVFENVAFACEVVGESKRTIKHRVPQMLSLVGLTGKERSFPDELSGGEQQRVALARALINDPVLLLADEPTGNLDSKASREIMDLLRLSNEKYHQTIIMITHDMNLAKEANRIITLEDGHIVKDEKIK